MPFKSKAQERAAFGGYLGKEMKKKAPEFAKKTDQKRLPEKVKKKGKKRFSQKRFDAGIKKTFKV